MKKIIWKGLGIMTMFICLSSCFSSKTVTQSTLTTNLALETLPPENKYINLDYGVKLNVLDERASGTILKQWDGASLIKRPQMETNPDVLSFISESVRRYMRTLGFQLNVDEESDYMMIVKIKEFNVAYLSGTDWNGLVELNVEIYDARRTHVYPNVAIVGRSRVQGSSMDSECATKAINQAYLNALKDIDWDRIAYFLKKADTPKQEKNKMVEGQGNTSLESTIIRWFIDSAPKGADVSWRVVSSTPDVKNTNQNYLGSTPHEETKSFGIRGLTFNNSGDVQIEITCEKTGYITQKKRFNVRQAIEQDEISTKFILVKED